MTQVIYKYPIRHDLHPGQVYTLRCPEVAKFLHFGEDNDRDLCVWVQVDSDSADVERRFVVMGTGWEIPEGHWNYVSSAIVSPYVWHFFIEPRQP